MRDKYSEISENCGLNETSQRQSSYKYEDINSSFAVQFIPPYTPTTNFACGILTEHVALFALRITRYIIYTTPRVHRFSKNLEVTSKFYAPEG